jgi:hypothetical protein
MADRYWLAVCLECEPRLPMPFRDLAERDTWAAGHSAGTRHEVARLEATLPPASEVLSIPALLLMLTEGARKFVAWQHPPRDLLSDGDALGGPTVPGTSLWRDRWTVRSPGSGPGYAEQAVVR